MHTVRKLLKQESADAWFCMLRAPMEEAAAHEGQESGPATKWDLLCQEFADVFEEPGVPHERGITHNIHLVDEAAAPPPPR